MQWFSSAIAFRIPCHWCLAPAFSRKNIIGSGTSRPTGRPRIAQKLLISLQAQLAYILYLPRLEEWLLFVFSSVPSTSDPDMLRTRLQQHPDVQDKCLRNRIDKKNMLTSDWKVHWSSAASAISSLSVVRDLLQPRNSRWSINAWRRVASGTSRPVCELLTLASQATKNFLVCSSYILWS